MQKIIRQETGPIGKRKHVMENIRERERTEVQGKGKTIGKKIKKQTKMRNQI